ncbi:hypothetical protein ACJX0J_009785, partial [Zea mays]
LNGAYLYYNLQECLQSDPTHQSNNLPLDILDFNMNVATLLENAEEQGSYNIIFIGMLAT